MALRLVAAGLAAAAYLGGSHWLMTSAPSSRWSAVAIVGPMLAAAAAVAWQRRQRMFAIVLAGATAALVVQADRGGGVAPETLYLGPHDALPLLLAFVIGSTLAAGREPLVSALARRVHGRLTPAMAAYSRKVNVAWTLYFVAMALVSDVVFATAPFALWATFANLVTPLAIVAMFVGEYLLRYRLHPEFERATLAQAVRAYNDRAASHD